MENINAKQHIIKVKKRLKILYIVVMLTLIINAIVWVSTLFIYYHNNFILLIIGLSCVIFMIVIIIAGIFADKQIKRDLKVFVESFEGAVSVEDKKTAAELLKKWKKHYISSIKWVLNEFREEKYPFGMQIIEDLVTLKKGIKVENRSFYALLANGDFGEIGNQLLCEISKLIESNSYTIEE